MNPFFKSLLSFFSNNKAPTTSLSTSTASGIDKTGRPELRQTSLIGMEIPPDIKTYEFLRTYMGWTFNCVSAIATETAQLELKLTRRTSQNTYEPVEVHPVLELLYKVNPLYTSYLLWEATQAYLELSGESFWYLAGPVNSPTEIWILRPDWVEIVDSQEKLISHYMYGPSADKQIKIPFESMIHFKDFNPVNSYRGYGTVRATAKTIDETEFMLDYSRAFFKNSAVPGGVLSTENSLTDSQHMKLRDEWNNVHEGKDKAWKVAILQAGLKWSEVGTSRREMDFIEGRKLSRDEILAAFRVPKTILGITDDVNRANSRDSRAVFLENVITPKMQRIVTFLNEFLLPRYGDDSLFFNFKSPVPNDQQATLARYQNALANGWMTRNEVREAEGLEPLKGGDTLMVPFSLQELNIERTPDDKAAQNAKEGARFNVRVSPYSSRKYQNDLLKKKLVENVYNYLMAIKAKKLSKPEVIHKLSTTTVREAEGDNPDFERWKQVTERTDRYETGYKTILNNLFEKQQAGVLSIVDQGIDKAIKPARIKATTSDVVSYIAKETEVFAAPLQEFIKDLIGAEGIIQIQQLTPDKLFFLNSVAVENFIRKDSLKYIKAIQQTTADLIKEALSSSLANGDGIPVIKDKISQIYLEATTYRAETIARSEVMRATNFAALESYRQSGVVKRKRWITSFDERTCAWCPQFNGKIIELDKDWAKIGDVIQGTNASGNLVSLKVGIDDVGSPPLHPNCRCVLAPVIESAN